MTIAVEVASSDLRPACPRIGADRSASDHTCPVHFPARGLAVRVLPQDVGKAVAIEVAVRDCRHAERRRILYIRGKLDCARGGPIGAEQILAHAIVGVEFNRPVHGRQVGRRRTPDAGIDVLDHHRARGRPVRLPQFLAMRAVVGFEVERAVDVRQIGGG